MNTESPTVAAVAPIQSEASFTPPFDKRFTVTGPTLFVRSLFHCMRRTSSSSSESELETQCNIDDIMEVRAPDVVQWHMTLVDGEPPKETFWKASVPYKGPRKRPRSKTPITRTGDQTTGGETRSPRPVVIHKQLTHMSECVTYINELLQKSDLHTSLRPHQIRVLNHMQSNRGLLVNHDLGTGKTILALATAMCLLLTKPHKIEKACFIVPKQVMEHFKRQLNKYFHVTKGSALYGRFEFYNPTTFQMAYQRGEIRDLHLKNALLVVDEAHAIVAPYKRGYNVKRSTRKGVRQSLSEPQRFKGAKRVHESTLRVGGQEDTALEADVSHVAQVDPVRRYGRNHAIVNTGRHASRVLLMTATPFRNQLGDIVNYLAILADKAPQDINTRAITQYLTGVQPLSFETAHLLNGKISVHRRSMEEFPWVREQTVELTMTDSYYKAYRQVETSQSKDKKFEQQSLAFYSALRKASIVADLDEVNNPKVARAIAIVRSFVEKKQKVLVYSFFVSAGVQTLKKRFSEENIPFAEITGATTIKERSVIVKEYNENRGPIVLLITKAAGEGMDLKETRAVVHFEASWNLATVDQVNGRAIRYRSHASLPKDDQTVDVYYLVLRKPPQDQRDPDDATMSADAYMWSLTTRKQKSIAQGMHTIEKHSIEKAAVVDLLEDSDDDEGVFE